MQVWELHRDLANSIGDSCQITSTAIPDGVRFGRVLRDSYLYRAMLDILARAIKQVAGMPRKQAEEILRRLFPNMITQQIVTYNLIGTWIAGTFGQSLLQNTDYQVNGIQSPYMAYVLSARANRIGNALNVTVAYPLPVKQGISASGLFNTRNVQRADSFCEHYFSAPNNGEILMIYDPISDLVTGDNILVDYLPYPLPLSQFSDPNSVFQPSLTREVNFEPAYIPNVLALASLYAMTDGQDIENIDRYLPMQLGLQGGQ